MIAPVSINIIKAQDKIDISKKALNLVKKVADQETLLLLSGGSSPDLLYNLLAEDKTLKVGAVALIDERYGEYMHDKSNEKMISDSGLVSYLNNEGVPFYGILSNLSLKETAEQYDIKLRELLNKFPKKLAIMGIGADSHTAGIKPGLKYDHTKIVTDFEDKEGPFGKRVTMTFEGLARIDQFILLVFGDNKKEALQNIFKKDSQQDFPAAFYRIEAKNVTIFTDISW